MGYCFIILDSGPDYVNETQMAWLNGTLEENKDIPTLIFLHHLVNPIEGITHDEMGVEREKGTVIYPE